MNTLKLHKSHLQKKSFIDKYLINENNQDSIDYNLTISTVDPFCFKRKQSAINALALIPQQTSNAINEPCC